MMNQIMAGEHFTDRYFLQTANLDMTDLVYYVLEAEEISFDGTYNGGGYRILNLSLTAGTGADAEYNAVFPAVSGTILNLGVENTSIEGTYTAGIVRKLHNGGKLVNSYSRATVSGSSRGTGLVDYMTGSNLLLANCWFVGKASGNAVNGINWNASAPAMSNIYVQRDSASGISPFGNPKMMTKDEMQTQSFVDLLNKNL